jgi:Uma2 family endonuclease
MPLTVGDRPIRPITADEAIRMVQAGILGEDEHVELLDGVLTRVSPQHEPHAVVVQRLTRWLAPLMVRGTHDVRVQLPFRVPDPTSLPEPDLAVVLRDDTEIGHPTGAPLVIEVAESSVRVDLGRKVELYASAAVPEYWVIDLRGRAVERFAGPEHGAFGARTTSAPPERLVPAALDVAPLDLADLFRGL